MANTFNFTQTVPASVWLVKHNLNSVNVNTAIIVDDIDKDNDINTGLQEAMIPLNIVPTDVNTVTVSFSRPFCGRARVVTYKHVR
jgi:hypothetical protein